MRGYLMVAMVVLAGCSASADTTVAEHAVDAFHNMLDAGQFEALYVGSAEDLQKVTTQQNFVALLGAIHKKLGNVKATTRQTWNVNYHTSGTFVTLNYSTTYVSGDAAEQFVYRMQDGKALLVGYHVNSNALVVN